MYYMGKDKMGNENCIECTYCNNCGTCTNCSICTNCNYCNNCLICESCSYCTSCKECNICNRCTFSTKLRMSEYMIFCIGEGEDVSNGVGYQENHRAFNKLIPPERWDIIYRDIKNILSNLKFYFDCDNWTEEWKKVTGEQWRRLSNIPEFDKKVVEQIVGFKINFDDKIKIVVEGKTTYISRESAQALNLI